jgi:hypothetical protein
MDHINQNTASDNGDFDDDNIANENQAKKSKSNNESQNFNHSNTSSILIEKIC